MGKKLKETFSSLSQTSFFLLFELLKRLSLDYLLDKEENLLIFSLILFIHIVNMFEVLGCAMLLKFLLLATLASWLWSWRCQSVYRLFHHFGNISFGWIDVKLDSCILQNNL